MNLLQILIDINWQAVGLQAGQLILSLSILVILHELGHFIPAKLFRCRVEKFYLFFDPWFSIFKKKVGETEYGVGWLPLGGYVKIAGMVDESMDKEQLKKPAEPWEFRSKPAWQRLIIEEALREIHVELEDLNAEVLLGETVTVERNGQVQEVALPVNLIEKLVETRRRSPLFMPRIPALVGEISDTGNAKHSGLLVNDQIVGMIFLFGLLIYANGNDIFGWGSGRGEEVGVRGEGRALIFQSVHWFGSVLR